MVVDLVLLRRAADDGIDAEARHPVAVVRRRRSRRRGNASRMHERMRRSAAYVGRHTEGSLGAAASRTSAGVRAQPVTFRRRRQSVKVLQVSLSRRPGIVQR